MDKAHELMVTICNFENSLELQPINLEEDALQVEKSRKELAYESDHSVPPTMSTTPTKNITIFF